VEGCEYIPVCPDPAVYNWPTRSDDGNITGYVHAFTTKNAIVIIWNADGNWTTTSISAYAGTTPPENLPEGMSYTYTAPGPVNHIELVIPFCDLGDADCGSTFYLAVELQTSDESWIQSDTQYIAAQGCCCFDYSSYYSETASSTMTFTSASIKRFTDDPDEIATIIASLLQVTPSSVYVISFEVDENGFSTVEIGFSDSQTTPKTAADLLATLDPAEFEKVGLSKVTVGGLLSEKRSNIIQQHDTYVNMDEKLPMVGSAILNVPTLMLLLLLGSIIVFLLQ
jgi:hypothetical protein